MKKTFKSILCLLFAMIFVFQFIGTAAFADGNDEEEEPVDISAAIFVGEDEYSGAVSLDKLKEGVRVVPSEKAYVASVSINGEPVTGYCIADGRVLEMDGDSVYDLIDNEKIDPDDALFAIEAIAEELPEDLESVTAPSADEAEVAEGREFVCWKFLYDNNSIALLEPGEEFVPFMGGEFVALTREIEAEEPEEELEEEPEEEPEEVIDQEVVVNLGGGLLNDPGDEYTIYVTVNDNSAEYTGETIPAPTGSGIITITKVVKNTVEESPTELAKYSLSGVALALSKDSVAGYYKDIGNYDLIIPDPSSISASYNSNPLSGQVTLSITNGKFEITKRALSVKAADVSKKYDGTVLAGAATGDKLLKDHTISGAKFVGETAAICDTTYTVDATKSKVADIVIKDINGNNVTSLYDISFDGTSTAKYTITAPETDKITELKVKAASVSKDYTGNPVDGAVTILEGSIPEGATIEPTFVYEDAHTAIGSHKYHLDSLKVMLDGHDISAAFDITARDTEATLTIVGHPLTITIRNCSKEYDGSPLVADPADCTVEGLLAGHSLYSITLSGSQTDYGSSKSDVSQFVIHDGDDNDVTGFYVPTVARGDLTVNKLTFTVEAKDAKKQYDGTALAAPAGYKPLSSADKAKLDKLATNLGGTWALNVTVTGSRTEVGVSDSKITSLELKVDSTVINPINYQATLKPGKLEVEEDPLKPTVTITVESASKTYDGKALLLEPDAYRIDSDKLPSGYSIKVTLETASITGAGTKTVGVKEYKVYHNDTLVEDPSEYPVNIKIVEGKLEVKKYPVTITAKSGTKYYDGKEFILNAVTITAADNKLVDGQKPDITVEAQDDDGNPVKAIKVGKYYNVVTQVVIKEGNKDVTDNYDITTVNGTLTIKNSNGNPQTGDTSNISLWATVLAVSAVAVVCIAVIFIVRNKKKAD